MRSLAVVVAKTEAEPVRRRLLDAGLLDVSLRIGAEGDNLLLPVRAAPAGPLPLREADFVPVESRPRTYRDVCRVPEALRALLPSSLDQVGDIVVLKLPEPLLPHAREVGRAILGAQRTMKVVALDAGVKGAFRVRELTVVAGEPRLETVHRENGVRLHVDLSKAYFSPRLATERMRLVHMVREGEVVVDLFSGVGPLALLIARHARARTVYAVDANPEAFRLLKENVRLNRAGNVVPALADARDFLGKALEADRIVLDLPHGAGEFLHGALTHVRPGGTVHHYEILEIAAVEDHAAKLEAAGGERKVRVAARRLVHAYSPAQGMFAFDLAVS